MKEEKTEKKLSISAKRLCNLFQKKNWLSGIYYRKLKNYGTATVVPTISCTQDMKPNLIQKTINGQIKRNKITKKISSAFCHSITTSIDLPETVLNLMIRNLVEKDPAAINKRG